MARQTQPRSQGEQLWGKDRQLPSAEAESVAELHRAQMGSWQAQGGEVRGLLGAYELADRVCGAFGCPHHEHLTIPQEVA